MPDWKEYEKGFIYNRMSGNTQLGSNGALAVWAHKMPGPWQFLPSDPGLYAVASGLIRQSHNHIQKTKALPHRRRSPRNELWESSRISKACSPVDRTTPC